MNKLYLMIIACILWTVSRVIRHYENNLMVCGWGEFWPDWIFYPIFTIMQILKYGVFPLCIATGFYIIFF